MIAGLSFIRWRIYPHRVHGLVRDWRYIEQMSMMLRAEMTVRDAQELLAKEDRIKVKTYRSWPGGNYDMVKGKEAAKPDYWSWGI
jgi:hypothetical protein